MRRPLSPHDLPACWQRPVPVDRKNIQRMLFQTTLDEVLEDLRVSHDDLYRWQQRGWLSADATENSTIDMGDPIESEIAFVRDLARSGLGDSQINMLLRSIPKPYRFPSSNEIAFHFRFGWVTPSKFDPAETIERHLDDWLVELAESSDGRSRLHELLERITELLSEDDEDTDA